MLQATLQFDNGKFKVIDPREGKGVQVFAAKDAEQASALLNTINAEISAEGDTATASGTPKMITKNGKATIVANGLGYKGQIFSAYAADFEALIAYFGAPADSQAVKDFTANRAKLCASWQAYGDLPVGATLPDGTSKPAPKPRGAR